MVFRLIEERCLVTPVSRSDTQKRMANKGTGRISVEVSHLSGDRALFSEGDKCSLL
jgi:hypothetical protein